MNNEKNNKNGFTLVELIAVIAIIAILTLMAVPAVLKIYNENVIKTMSVQENEVVNAANLFIEDYCNSPLDNSKICPKSYEKVVDGKKTVCLNDLQNEEDKYISSVKYKNSNCTGYVTYYFDSKTELYGNGKAYLFCGKNSNGG